MTRKELQSQVAFCAICCERSLRMAAEAWARGEQDRHAHLHDEAAHWSRKGLWWAGKLA